MPMIPFVKKGAFAVAAALVAVGTWGSEKRATEKYLSPLAIISDAGGDKLYIAEATANQVALFDVKQSRVLKVLPLPDPPGGLALSADGLRLYVSGASPEGKVHVVDTRTGRVEYGLPAGHTPTGLVLGADGMTLYACNRFSDDVSVLDLAARKQVASIPVSRRPVAAALTPGGRYLLVVNQLPAGRADGDYNAALISVIDTGVRKVVKEIPLLNGATGMRGICLSPDGKYAYVTHILARYQLPTTQLERGWMNTNAISILDVDRQELVTSVLLDGVEQGAANPWGVACTADGRFLCVAQAGTHELSVIDRLKLHEKIAAPRSGSPVDPPNDLAFLFGLRQRLRLQGNGPRGLALVGHTAYVTEYFTDSLGVLNIDPGEPRSTRSVPLGPKVAMSVERRGEMLFHNAQYCFQKWQSCSTCHPADGRPDALNWDLLNDGIGNPKNTKSLLLAHKTPPAMSTGVREDTEAAVRAGLRFIYFAERPEEEAVAIDEYLKSLQPAPSPYLVKGRLSERARRGREVFKKAGCDQCHPPPLFTDKKEYEMGTGKGMDGGRPFDTPTLIEVWRTAPYLHDGRAATLREVLLGTGDGKTHGSVSGLTDEQLADLIEYVLSL